MRVVGMVLGIAACLVLGATLVASGPVGIYGIVEKVVFEPDERNAERIQVWGAFAYVDGSTSQLGVSEPRRGFLYFKLPSGWAGGDPPQIDIVKREWADLKAVAGTGQAVGFGSWGYVGAFAGLQPDRVPSGPPYILERGAVGSSRTDLRVRPASAVPGEPASYQTNAGIIKLADQGSRAAIVARLRDTLRQ